MGSGSGLWNGVMHMGLRELLKYPLPSRYRAPQGDDPHGELDRCFQISSLLYDLHLYRIL